MATRATLIFRDQHERFDVYHHYDGYPSYILTKIAEAKDYAWPLPRFEASDFAAAFVRATKTKDGGNVYLTKDAFAHWDTAYRYEVFVSKTDRLQVRISEASYASRKGKQIFRGSLETALARDWEG